MPYGLWAREQGEEPFAGGEEVGGGDVFDDQGEAGGEHGE